MKIEKERFYAFLDADRPSFLDVYFYKIDYLLLPVSEFTYDEVFCVERMGGERSYSRCFSEDEII